MDGCGLSKAGMVCSPYGRPTFNSGRQWADDERELLINLTLQKIKEEELPTNVLGLELSYT